MESDNISSKPWQLIGEVTEKQRPKNALLEEHLEFDHMSRTGKCHTITHKVDIVIPLQLLGTHSLSPFVCVSLIRIIFISDIRLHTMAE